MKKVTPVDPSVYQQLLHCPHNKAIFWQVTPKRIAVLVPCIGTVQMIVEQ
jgi:hypothetical protein